MYGNILAKQDSGIQLSCHKHPGSLELALPMFGGLEIPWLYHSSECITLLKILRCYCDIPQARCWLASPHGEPRAVATPSSIGIARGDILPYCRWYNIKRVDFREMAMKGETLVLTRKSGGECFYHGKQGPIASELIPEYRVLS
ncbi:hypothetical protein I7I50_02106 [Histoplasma capsulatum G186AR]|uniref:Uncharacterized protein n=1 Tax=Ajellomyces capsulatus TaxID=5037 RepID=A0A8H8CU09_AJECA|nr:hypothetical protein I7I52_12320 [Histoplasma capsulatum]QSS71315.1 hypothetical protein I7I50_02106 [Histoplasma capsulatum G186AR]